jgi:hypothetical protein
MAKFELYCGNRHTELHNTCATLGVLSRDLIQKLIGTRPTNIFIEPKACTREKMRSLIITSMVRSLYRKPDEPRGFNTLEKHVVDQYGPIIDKFLDKNADLIVEIKLEGETR